MDIHVTNMTNKSWEAVYVVNKVRQLFCINIVTKIASSIGWRVEQTEKNVVCSCRLIDVWTT